MKYNLITLHKKCRNQGIFDMYALLNFGNNQIDKFEYNFESIGQQNKDKYSL